MRLFFYDIPDAFLLRRVKVAEQRIARNPCARLRSNVGMFRTRAGPRPAREFLLAFGYRRNMRPPVVTTFSGSNITNFSIA